MDSNQTVIDYYTRYDEDGRLDRHPSEFATTIHILDHLIGPKDRILDTATGTGRYALHFARKGHQVWAEDLVPRNIEILKGKFNVDLEALVKVRTNDARDLSAYSSGYFDVVLCMGPVYHLPEEEIGPTIEEALRVLRPGGLIAISFVNKYPGYEESEYVEWISHYSSREIIRLLPTNQISINMVAACDGPAFDELEQLLRMNTDTSENAEEWFASHRKQIEGDSWLDACCHGLVIGKKV